MQSKETVPTFPFVVTLKWISGINLRKEVEDSCSKTLTSLQKEKDTCSWVGRIHMVRMTAFPKVLLDNDIPLI